MESTSYHGVTGWYATGPRRVDITGENRCVTTVRLVIQHTGYGGVAEKKEIVLFADGDNPAALIIQQPPAVEEVAA